MSSTVNLALNSAEMSTVVFGLLELRRVLVLSSIVDDERTQETNRSITAVLTKMQEALEQSVTESAL